MDLTVGTMLAYAFVAGTIVGTLVGYFVQRAGESRRTLERIRLENARRANELATKKKRLHDAGRRLPAQPGAGEPIRIRKMNYTRKG